MSDDIGVAEIHEWAQGLDEIGELIGEHFARTEPRHNAIGYIQGLFSDVERIHHLMVTLFKIDYHNFFPITVFLAAD